MVVGRKKERVFSVTQLVSSFSKRSPNGKREKWKMVFIIVSKERKEHSCSTLEKRTSQNVAPIWLPH